MRLRKYEFRNLSSLVRFSLPLTLFFIKDKMIGIYKRLFRYHLKEKSFLHNKELNNVAEMTG